jgi:hypothetical protein
MDWRILMSSLRVGDEKKTSSNQGCPMFSGGEKTISLADFGFLFFPLESKFYFPTIFLRTHKADVLKKSRSARNRDGIIGRIANCATGKEQEM